MPPFASRCRSLTTPLQSLNMCRSTNANAPKFSLSFSMAAHHCLRWLSVLIVTACLGCGPSATPPDALPVPTGHRHYRKTQPLQFHYPPLDLDAIKPLFPYRHLKTYRITDTISLKTRLDWGLFHQLFQHFADPPPYPKFAEDLPRTTYVQMGDDYLYSYLENVPEDYKPSWKFDIVTVYSRSPGKSCIYYLSYNSEDNVYVPYPSEGQSDIYPTQPKGMLSGWNLSLTLAEWQETDTATDEVFSSFLADTWLKRTEVHHSLQTQQTDSTIRIFNFVFIDSHINYDVARYRNGIELHGFEDQELRKKLHY